MTLQTTPTGFTIILTDMSTFKAICKAQGCDSRKRYAGPPWGMDRRVKPNKSGFTMEAEGCTAGSLTNGRKANLYHVNPKVIPDRPRIRVGLQEDVTTLSRRTKEPLRGILAGGFQLVGIPEHEEYIRLSE